jgi:hypothetical protein
MQGPDTDAQDQPPPFTQIRLATHGRSIQMGQNRKCCVPCPTSGLTPKGDAGEPNCQVCEGLNSDYVPQENSRALDRLPAMVKSIFSRSRR